MKISPLFAGSANLSAAFAICFLPISQALAEPISFPESGKFEFDFESDPLDSGWTLEIESVDEFGDPIIGEYWTWQPIFESGVEEMDSTGGGLGQVRASSSGLDDFEFDGDGAEYPLTALIAPKSYLDLGFSTDQWLINLGAGNATENDDGQFVNLNRGAAKLELKDLPAHKALKIGVKVGVGGSIDGGNNENRDGSFEIVVDGESAFTHLFNTNGENLNGAQGVETLAVRENLTPNYREQWNDNGGDGPSGPDDRAAIGWILDSAYDLNAVPSLAAIPHTADTLTLEFVHRLSSPSSDEHIAIDDLVVELIAEDAPSPNAWPGGNIYTNGFESIGGEWTLGSEWVGAAVPDGVDMMTGSGGNTAQVRFTAHPDGFGEAAFDGVGTTFPLESVVEALDLAAEDIGFAGRWISSNASATKNGQMELNFTDLPPHTGIDLDFVLASFDSIDGDDVIPDEDSEIGNANFQIWLDDERIYEARYNGNGISSDSEGIEELLRGVNFSENYREQWNDSDEGPIDADDRTALGWTLDAAYDYSTYFDADGDNAIAHTADTLSLRFVHGLDGPNTDEGLAIDGFSLELIGATAGPTPEFAITDISYLSNAVTLIFPSSAGQTYGVDRSFNLQDWSEVSDGVPANADGDSTTFSDESIPADTREAYYRIRRE